MGDNCEIPIDACQYEPPICLNNGHCRNMGNGTFNCLCIQGPGSFLTGGYINTVINVLVKQEMF